MMANSFKAAMDRLEQASVPCKARLLERLRDLAVLFHEDYGNEPKASALSDLTEFFASAQLKHYTSITMTPDGGFYVEWQSEAQQKVAVEFMGGGVARLFSFRPNPRHPERSDVFTCTTTADALMDALAPWNPWKALAA
jgi:hypothetical protein